MIARTTRSKAPAGPVARAPAEMPSMISREGLWSSRSPRVAVAVEGQGRNDDRSTGSGHRMSPAREARCPTKVCANDWPRAVVAPT